MAKHRLGVALVIPPPLSIEVDAIRRALGDGALGRIAPHVTLVPPVNVRGDALGEALELIREAAASTEPFELTLGPPATFLPVSPVLYLQVGLGVDVVRALRARIMRPPLWREEEHPFVPHVTVADEASEEAIDGALRSLAHYGAVWRVERVELLEQLQTDRGRVWVPVADAALGGPAVVGRGGFEVTLDAGCVVPLDARGLLERVPPWHPDALVVTAFRAGAAAGVAVGRVAGTVARLDTVAVHAEARREGIGSHVLRAFEREAQRRGCELGAGPHHEFLLGRGWRSHLGRAMTML